MWRAGPAVAAVALTTLTAYDLTGAVTLAPILAASGLVYLGSAALGRPAAAWPMFGATFVVVTAAALTLALNATAGAYLVAAGRLGHAAWDFYHRRIDTVVSRSLAEFCLVLDTLLAVAVLVVAIP